ncbi:MAG: hypothetical protein AAF829_05985 [Pseudomonadota bacterium]
MTEPSFKDPQIEVVFRPTRQNDLLSRLASAGFRPINATAPIETHTSVPLLIDLSTTEPNQLEDLGFAASADLNRPVVLLGELRKPLRPNAKQIHVTSLELISSLPARLDLRRRSLLRENERALRQKTEHTFGNPLYFEDKAKRTSSPKVLYLGPIGTRFLPLSKGLAARGVQVVASITAQTAQMHLDAETFRLLLIEGTQTPEDVAMLIQGRGDLPVFIIGSDALNVYDGCVDVDQDSETAYDFISDRAKSEPLKTQLDRVRLGATSHDPMTGLYSEAFLRAHLPRQMAACAQYETPLTLLHLRCRDSDLDSSDLVTLSNCFVANLRETDLLVRLNSSSFLAVLRDTSYAGAARLASRLIAVVENHADYGTRFAERLLWRAVERRGGFTPDSLIQSVLSGPYSKAIAA